MALIHQPLQTVIDLWKCGVEAVLSSQLIRAELKLDPSSRILSVQGNEFKLKDTSKIVVVGAGKASSGMACGVEEIFKKTQWFSSLTGWVNVPADTTSNFPMEKIQLHAARPAGSNFPTAEGVYGTKKICELLSGMREDDLAIILISGGGSALLPLPISEITLAQKIWITRHLSSHGATIQELNIVRTALSAVKGGKLLQHIPAGNVLTLIISDIIGDPIDLIASGPTVPARTTPQDALQILLKYPATDENYQFILSILEKLACASHPNEFPTQSQFHNLILANNNYSLQKIAKYLEELFPDYKLILEQESFSSDAVIHARKVAQQLSQLKLQKNPAVYLAGGETTVDLSNTSKPGKGGRNQEVVLAVLCEFWEQGMEGIYFLSGGTDGEDGPTDAAGAFIHQGIWQKAHELNLDPFDYLQRHDAYHFFEQVGGLLKTGPTHTNVMDIEVGLVT